MTDRAPTWEVIHGDCLDVMRDMGDNSVDAVITDPPYFRVKDEPWDRQWNDADAFIAWLREVIEQWHRLLRPNGSLYVFASPRMAARVELAVGEAFNVLNHIVWAKQCHNYTPGDSRMAGYKATDKAAQRMYNPFSERIIFAEHYGADNIAKGEAGYVAKCDELRGFVFEPLRAYLDGERERSLLSVQDVAEAWRIKTGNANRTGMAGHWFSQVQFILPTAENYQWLRDTLNKANCTTDYLWREYEDLREEYEDLRREYEDLREEYETLRRPFQVSPDVPYTDVWTFPTVSHYPGKHPCEKPLDMLRHMIAASTRDGAVVLDSFAGTGSTGIACRGLGREFVGIEANAGYVDQGRRRIEAAAQQTTLFDGGNR